MTHQPDSATLPDETHVGRTALRVSDLGEMIDFYRTVVGLEVLRRVETTATLGVDRTALLKLEQDTDAHTRDRTGTGLYHNAFRVPSRGALGDALRRVRERWQLDGASDHRVSEALYLTDPAGNGIEIYRDRPRETWPIADDGSVLMATDPLDLDSVGAAAAGDERVPPGTDVGHVHLEVSSLDAFREFYVDTLGFEVRASVPAALFVAAGGYHHHIGANTWHHRTTPVQGRGLSWFEVVVPTNDALAAIRERVQGHVVDEADDGFAVTDPDGIEVRLRAEARR